jgi:hypothetical protein
MERSFVLKVEQYHAGEGYEGFWLVYATSLENAIKILREEKTVKWLGSLGGLEIRESSMDEARGKFHEDNLCKTFEICGDNYN